VDFLPEALGTHGGTVRAARNEMNVCAGLLQSGAEEAADASGADDGDFIGS
jgi:hypothetical protein